MSTSVVSKRMNEEIIIINGEVAGHIWAEDCGWEYILAHKDKIWTITAIDYTKGSSSRTDTSGTKSAILSFLDSSKIGGCAWGGCASRFRSLMQGDERP